MGGEGVENKIERRFAQTLVRVVEREEHVEHGVAFIAARNELFRHPTRITKVKKTMSRIKFVLTERAMKEYEVAMERAMQAEEEETRAQLQVEAETKLRERKRQINTE